MNKSALVLFDIDGTILTSGGAGERSLSMAVRDRFGVEENLSEIEIAGKTDTGIALRIFEKHGIETSPENLASFFDCYLSHLALELPKSKGAILPGVMKLLQELKALPHVALALLTGNLSAGAKLKLSHFQVWEFFDFGAFADDHHDRNLLGPFAQKRALEMHGVEFEPARIYVLGDTPHDINCGRVLGARTVAIATGKYSLADLQAHHPDFLFADLSDTAEVIRTLGI